MRLGRVCSFLKRDNSYLENKTLLFLFNFFFSSKAYLRSILKKKRFFYGSFSSYSYAYNVANTIQEATLWIANVLSQIFFIYDCEFWINFNKQKIKSHLLLGGIRVMMVEICSGISVLKMPRLLLSAVLVLPCPTIKCPLFRIFVILNTHCSRYW